MNFASAEAVANAVLFEGYILYPYRPSAIKNRQRWNFGTLYPRNFAEAQRPEERWRFQAQVLMQVREGLSLSARARFIQLGPPEKESGDSWEEGVARSCTVADVSLDEMCGGAESLFDLTKMCGEEAEAMRSSPGKRQHVGRLTLTAEKLGEDLYLLSASFANETSVSREEFCSRRAVQDVAFTSAHLLLEVENGAFVSLLEPPGELEAGAKRCVQEGVFPVLTGEAGDRSQMLCSPIILYDYPQVALESAGDFFDGTEMDEMLALRVLTLTDEEKAEMRRGDSHARAILERTEGLAEDHLLKLHGVVKGLREASEHDAESKERAASMGDPFDPFQERPPLESVRVFGVEIRCGHRVRIWPQKRADIMDMAMEGKVAIIEAIEQDFEDNVQLAVVLEDDPGRDLGMQRQAGHRFFFSPDEIEPLGMEVV